MPTRILIVEDEPKLAAIESDYLTQSGYNTSIISNGMDVVPFVKQTPPDLILLDLMLPGKDGMEVCKEIRQFSNTPIIMITARVEEIDRLLGLELGADDYICKPFSPREVVARVKAVLRRSQPATDTSALSNTLSLDESRYKALIKNEEVSLTAVEFQLLSKLFSAPGRIYSREQLMDHIYSDHRVVSDRTIDSHIKKIRKKIAEVCPEKELIHSVYGVGYKYEVPED
ncbi:response regulator [Alkalimarinus coralli]|uniref:response regulator n=1 Tax=Alkalimarinus coralli TaxID=2935863 RepID=UPI00202B4FAF|nr:response regulator [Alkalimarinus coralli]